MDIPDLSRAIQSYYIQGLAPNIHKTYQAGQSCYASFCQHHNLSPLPATESTLLLFMASLAKEGVSYTTIKIYLSAIRSLHITAKLHTQFASQLTPYLGQVMQGIKREQLHTRPLKKRLPVTTSIMRQIKEVLLCHPHQYHNILMWAVCCTAFFGFLRCSEFTIPTQQSYDPEVHLSIDDLAIDSIATSSLIKLTIK